MEPPNQSERYEQEKVLKHVQEVLFEKKLQGVYARDQTDRPVSVKISLP